MNKRFTVTTTEVNYGYIFRITVALFDLYTTSQFLNLFPVQSWWLYSRVSWLVRMVFITGIKDVLLTGNSALHAERAASLSHLFRTVPFF